MLQFENGLDNYEESNSFGNGTFLRGSTVNSVELRVFSNYEHFNTIGAKFVVMNPENTVLGIGASFIYNQDLYPKKFLS